MPAPAPMSGSMISNGFPPLTCTSAWSSASVRGGVSCWATPPICLVRLAERGLNAALMDAADIAWKLALVVRGAAKPSLLLSYATERGLADDHVLEVSARGA